MLKINKIKLNEFFLFIKKNYLLGILYPIVIFLNLFLLKNYKAQGLLYLFIIINLLNQFDIGLLKNTFFNQVKYKVKLVFFLLVFCILLLTIMTLGIFSLFKMELKGVYLFVVIIGLIASELKSFFDSRSKYFIGFFLKNCLNLSVIVAFLMVPENIVYIPLIGITLLSVLFFLTLYQQLQLTIKKELSIHDLKFFSLNIFTFISGNLDRFLVIPLIGQPIKNTYLYYSETNSKLNGLFGFLNNLFLYKQLKLSRLIIIIVSAFLIIVLLSVFFVFNLNLSYLLFSLSLIFSVFSQYFIFSKIGELKGISASLFPLIGMSVYITLFFIQHVFIDVNLFVLTCVLICKSISEAIFIYKIAHKQLLSK